MKYKKTVFCLVFSVFVVFWIRGMINNRPPESERPKRLVRIETQRQVQEMNTAGTILITTQYPMVHISVDPDENVMACPVNPGFVWETAINGKPVKRDQLNRPTLYRNPDGSWDPNGPRPQEIIKTITYRLVEGQGLSQAKLTYVKYKGDSTPSGWYARALSNKLY